jgi:hypothetical protein
VIIGYSGSDGTIAWAWPERDMIILYFTQSRGGATPIRLEQEIQRLLLDPPHEAARGIPAVLEAVVGTYTANFDPFRNEPFRIVWRDGYLALDVPSEFIYPLDPTDQPNRWTLRDNPGASISFVRDETGAVSALRLERAGGPVTLPRGEPETEEEAVLSLANVEQYLGWYRDEESGQEMEVVLQAGRVALAIPGNPMPLELFPPNDDGWWQIRLNPAAGIRFAEQEGTIGAYTLRGPGGETTFTRFDRSRSE